MKVKWNSSGNKRNFGGRKVGEEEERQKGEMGGKENKDGERQAPTGKKTWWAQPQTLNGVPGWVSAKGLCNVSRLPHI